jgi:formamidopyrimidine-DNA glycosylase
MPELPEVETVRRGLAPKMEGAKIERVELRRLDLRYPFGPDFVEQLEGHTITSMGRRAKYLLVDIDSTMVLVMHLGMSGSFRLEQDGEAVPPTLPKGINEKHDHVVFHLQPASGKPVRVIYNDPRRFGFMAILPRNSLNEHPWFAGMGIEPTGNALNGAHLAEIFKGKKAPLKAALLDQKMIAGLGNIYVCEALWRAGLAPTRKAMTLADKNGKRAERLASDIRCVIDEAIAAGGSSLRDHRQVDGSLGYFQHRFAVYGRENEPCLKEGCNGTISRISQSGRSTFYCNTCQS